MKRNRAYLLVFNGHHSNIVWFRDDVHARKTLARWAMIFGKAHAEYIKKQFPGSIAAVMMESEEESLCAIYRFGEPDSAGILPSSPPVKLYQFHYNNAKEWFVR